MPTATEADAISRCVIERNPERSHFQLTNRVKRSRCAGPFQRRPAILLPPLAGDAPHHLRHEGGRRHVDRPRPPSGQHAVERLVEQVVRIVLTQTSRPDAGECRKPHEVWPAQAADDAANLAGGEMRRLIAHWSPTKAS